MDGWMAQFAQKSLKCVFFFWLNCADVDRPMLWLNCFCLCPLFFFCGKELDLARLTQGKARQGEWEHGAWKVADTCYSPKRPFTSERAILSIPIQGYFIHRCWRCLIVTHFKSNIYSWHLWNLRSGRPVSGKNAVPLSPTQPHLSHRVSKGAPPKSKGGLFSVEFTHELYEPNKK